jgi:hypothetical protein
MALPFLKKKDGAAASTPVEVLERKPDEDTPEDMDMLDACAEDFLQAIKMKDAKMLREALEALISHIQMLDEEQDKDME